ncbi:1,4-dihydroxy-2-naphthoate polyprenyltransferase [Buchananella hordeovulneris]|uniref:1,4-dihydroxy-2-naphthoate octaprenyltransferase n=1 Tax=Buchananella hordeovulneris TaxID=52770 RepID=A0A1Q5PYZ5_9ACTO|nr:1,4-dihydroxy-2-naphthoate polyprenyltransferase [Buchananella hordeovulneris]OKL52649.1 hypothetical protein BSZ40_00610 [Buchananella hordeovulneris]
MATIRDWLEGARLRTLPLAVSPVLAGTAAAAPAPLWGRALLAGAVAVGLTVGVNFANDYSDGIRGTDAHRVGPPRLTGAGLARPAAVKRAAFAAFAGAAVCGLVLVAVASQWWLIGLGVVAIVAAWFYTGGTRPYGYAGLGDLAVFVFYGLVATLGTTYTQRGSVPPSAWWLAGAAGAWACAVLMVNNLRDIPTDRQAGKRTLAVRLGPAGARAAFTCEVLAPAPLTWLAGRAVGLAHGPGLALTAATLAAGGALALPVLRGASGRALVGVLKFTGLTALGWAAACAALFLA